MMDLVLKMSAQGPKMMPNPSKNHVKMEVQIDFGGNFSKKRQKQPKMAILALFGPFLALFGNFFSSYDCTFNTNQHEVNAIGKTGAKF